MVCLYCVTECNSHTMGTFCACCSFFNIYFITLCLLSCYIVVFLGVAVWQIEKLYCIITVFWPCLTTKKSLQSFSLCYLYPTLAQFVISHDELLLCRWCVTIVSEYYTAVLYYLSCGRCVNILLVWQCLQVIAYDSQFCLFVSTITERSCGWIFTKFLTDRCFDFRDWKSLCGGNITDVYCSGENHYKEQEAFEKCWAHSPLRAAARAVVHCHSPGVATVARRHCRMPPAHRCPQQQRKRVTDGTAMAAWNGPNQNMILTSCTQNLQRSLNSSGGLP